MRRDPERIRPDRLLLQAIHQDEQISHHSGNHHQFSTLPLVAEAAVGLSITFLVFINAIASNYPRAFSSLLNDLMPASYVVPNDLPSITEDASGKTTDIDVHDLEPIDSALISAPDALAIFLENEDTESRHMTFIKSTMPAPPADEQGHDVQKINGSTSRKFDTHEALVAIQKAARRGSCISPNEPRTSRNIAVTFSNSGRATVARVANGRADDNENAGCMERALRTASVKPFDGAPATVYRTITVK